MPHSAASPDRPFQHFIDNPGLLADGIHPTNDGNDWLSRKVADVIGTPLPPTSTVEYEIYTDERVDPAAVVKVPQ